MNKLIGKTVGKYQILELVGQGGMAEVYKAYQAGLNRHVALKILHRHLAEDQDFISRFEREAKAVARLRHPNIIQVHDYDTFENNHYMVMEFIQGATLKDELLQRAKNRKEPQQLLFTPAEVAYIMTALSSGLDYAHAQGVVHRDLKPGNIMFTREGQLVLTDFGLVRLLDKPRQTSTGFVTGTPAYMSPEQAQGEEVDHRSDIYSLGIVLYELLAGTTPFEGESALSFFARQVSDAPVPTITHPDLPAELNDIIAKAMAYNPDDRYQTAGALANHLRQVVGITLDDLSQSQLTAGVYAIPNSTPLTPTKDISRPSNRHKPASPYRGLFAFREEDAPFFFGRENFTNRLETALNQNQFLLPVLGPSGSGKSSVIYAGLIPRLRPNKQWVIASFRPGIQPFNALAALLSPLIDPHLGEVDRLVETRRIAKNLHNQAVHLGSFAAEVLRQYSGSKKLLLFIDQFEELYTLCSSVEIRRKFLDLITTPSPADNIQIIFSMRADFLSSALSHPPLAQAIQHAPFILGPMSRDELTRAVEQPALKQKVNFEAGLIGRILDDVGSEPGNLPLLEFALTSLWDKQEQQTLTHQAYDQIGRVDGALARHAEAVFAELRLPEKEMARRVFTQLVRPGDNTEDTRRVATRTEIGEERWSLVRHLADTRLVITNRDPEGQETAEVVHEALIRSWDRLRLWLETDRRFRLWQERLRSSLRQWSDNNKDSGGLLRGALLTEAGDWFNQRRDDLNPAEREFIEQSLREEQQRREAQSLLRRRITAGLAFGLVITLVLSVVSVWQMNRALVAQNQAVRERDLAQASLSRQLAAQAEATLDENFDVGALLSIKAHQTFDTFVARNSLLKSLMNNPRLLAYLRTNENLTRAVSFKTDGQLIASGGVGGQIVLWQTRPPQMVGRLIGHMGQVRDLAFSPLDSTLASAGGNPGVFLWDSTSQQKTDELIDPQQQNIATLHYSPNGQYLLAGTVDGPILVWDVTQKQLTRQLEGHTGQITDIDVSGNGLWVLSSSLDGTVRLWDLATGGVLYQIDQPHSGIVWTAAFNPESTQFATGGSDGQLLFWDVITGKAVRRPVIRAEADNVWVTALRYIPHPTKVLVAAGYRDGQIIVWDVVRQRPDVSVGQLSGHTNIISRLSVNDLTLQMASAGQDGQLILWDVQETPRIGPVDQLLPELHNGEVYDLEFNRQGNIFVSGGQDGRFVFWDLVNGRFSGRAFPTSDPIYAVTYSPDSRYAASAGESGRITLWDTLLRRAITDQLRGHQEPVWSLAFSPDSKILVSGGADGFLFIWDVVSRQPIGTPIEAHNGTVETLAFTPDGTRLISGGADGLMRVWNPTTGRPIGQPLEAHKQTIMTIVFSPDGQYMASAGADRIIWLWHTADFTRPELAMNETPPAPIGEPLVGHERTINALSFSANSQLLASGSTGRANNAGEVGSGDDIVILWDVQEKRQIGLPLQTKHGRVYALAFSPDGVSLLSAGWDHQIVLWQVDPAVWSTEICQRLNRELTEEEWAQFMGEEPYTPLCSAE